MYLSPSIGSSNNLLTSEVRGNTVLFGGIIPWIPSCDIWGRTPGNRVGVRIIPKNDIEKIDAEITISGNRYDNSIFVDPSHMGTPYLRYYPLVTSVGETFRIHIDWERGKLIEDFTIKILDDSILEVPPCICTI